MTVNEFKSLHLYALALLANLITNMVTNTIERVKILLFSKYGGGGEYSED